MPLRVNGHTRATSRSRRCHPGFARAAPSARRSRIPVRGATAHPVRQPCAADRGLHDECDPLTSGTCRTVVHGPERCRRAPRRRTAAPGTTSIAITLPQREGSLKFAVIGDSGTGGRQQYEVAQRMGEAHAQYPFELVLMMGDNLYGSRAAARLRTEVRAPLQAAARRQSEVLRLAREPRRPRAALLQALQHGRRAVRLLQGAKEDVRFFALDSTYLDRVRSNGSSAS